MIASAYLAAEALGEWVDGHLAAECPAPGVAYSCGMGASVAHAITTAYCLRQLPAQSAGIKGRTRWFATQSVTSFPLTGFMPANTHV